MLKSMFSGVAGMNNNQVWIDAIGNNIANVNTVGYKTARVTFEDILSQTIEGVSAPTTERGGVNAKQIGLGATVATMQTVHSQGSLQATGKNTDLAIQGDGFFILKEGGADVGFYTRNGSFGFDSEGNLISLSNGLFVQGWEGTKDPATGKMAIDYTKPIEQIKIEQGVPMAPTATKTLTLEGNLSAQAKLAIDQVAATVTSGTASQGIVFRFKHLFDPNNPTANYYKWEALDPATYAPLAVTAGAAEGILALNDSGQVIASYTTANWDVGGGTAVANDGILEAGEIPVGVLHTGSFATTVGTGPVVVTVPTGTTASPGAISFTPTAGNGEAAVAKLNKSFEYQHKSSEAVYDSLGEAHTVPMVLERIKTNTWVWHAANPIENKIAGYGLLEFNANGILSASKIFPSPSDPALTEKYQGIYFDPPVDPTPPESGGAPPPSEGASPLKITLDLTNLVQFATQSSTADITSQDGFPSGILDSLKINSMGIIIGEYSNGRNEKLGQLALATFSNPSGLLKVEGTMFRESANSGEAVKAAPGKDGRSKLSAGTLEMSNVDLTAEFINMIIAQRAFSANSRTITTSDDMLREVIALKR
ncbi:flagellar hook protein FlgE [bacterium]|nr:flagellar hook protein FlgE [bacterium]